MIVDILVSEDPLVVLELGVWVILEQSFGINGTGLFILLGVFQGVLQSHQVVLQQCHTVVHIDIIIELAFNQRLL